MKTAIGGISPPPPSSASFSRTQPSSEWSCQHCTLVNSPRAVRCSACDHDNPAATAHSERRREGTGPVGSSAPLISKLKLPTFSLSSAVDKIDSAIGAVANQLQIVGRAVVPRDWQQQQPWDQEQQPSTSSAYNPLRTNIVIPSRGGISRMATDYYHQGGGLGNFGQWQCMRCGLYQSTTPLDNRCPLCRLAGSQQPRWSRSTPQLNISPSRDSHQHASNSPLHPSSRPATDTGNAAANSHLDSTAASTMLENHDHDDNSTSNHSPIYTSIVEFCRESGESFIDDGFPHTTASIGPIEQLEELRSRLHRHQYPGGGGGGVDLPLLWLRPQQIVTRDGRLTRWSVFNDPQPGDIEQGALGNCWFLSALAVVAERPDVLERLLVTKEYSHAGVYEVRLCVDGLWQRVIVDDFFPCHALSRTMIFAVGRKNQLWVSLIEKALAKVYGSYAQLRAGRTIEGLATLTGAPCQLIDLEELITPGSGAPAAVGTMAAAWDTVWAQLLSAREARFLMGCSCGAGKQPVNDADYRRVGLMPRHAYSILDVRQLNTNDGVHHRLVLLRNPWGTFVWEGEWGPRWTGWTPALRRELDSSSSGGHKSGMEGKYATSGTFWMPFEAFVQHFDSLDLAELRPPAIEGMAGGWGSGWSATRYPIDLGLKATSLTGGGGNSSTGANSNSTTTTIKMTILEPTELCATCFQRGARTLVDQADLLLTIHAADPSSPGSSTKKRWAIPGEMLHRSPRRIQASVRTEDFFLPPGDYVLCAHSYAKMSTSSSTVPGAVVIHSSKRIITQRQEGVPAEHMRMALTALILKEGSLEQLMPGCMVRFVSNEFAGLVMMIDNLNRGSCLQVISDCQGSENVVSSRCTLLAADSIPPLHRQITTLLTHFEPSQPYIVGHRISQRLTPFAQLRDFAPTPRRGSAAGLCCNGDASLAYLAGEMQNYPQLEGADVLAVHAPKPLYA